LVRDMDDEVRFHLGMRADELRAQGRGALEAEAEALRRFGDTGEFHSYAVRRASRHLRFALRQAARGRTVTCIAVLTLALCIGANTAIFTVVHRLLLAPLPYPDGNRIVLLAVQSGDRGPSSPNGALVDAWRARARSVAGFAAVRVDAILVQDTQEQDTITATITSNYLDLLGIH